ncbi:MULTISPECIES: DUF1905 domain-containing protein [unclassified Phenylobacterium]|uniref:DUF1905 domain-containing protein n=1 Tax=unclassified Phenylobacterium TaxID=2640670 RepID=UPI00083A1D91|nr:MULTISPECIES: DUF1905 domain-containing protein [unclassified Phenylobacterium]
MIPHDEAFAAIAFEAEVIHWRGPSPYFFAAVPTEQVELVRQAARAASYGWGVVPVDARIGEVAFETSLFPKDGGYLLPLKDAVRRKANITAGDAVAVEMAVRPRNGRPARA